MERSYVANVLFDNISLMGNTESEGQQLRYSGIGNGHDDIIIKGDLDALKVSLQLDDQFAGFLIEIMTVHRLLREEWDDCRSCDNAE